MKSEYEFLAMAHWRWEAGKSITANIGLDAVAELLKSAHELGWIEALEWAKSQIVVDKEALEKFNEMINNIKGDNYESQI